MTDAKRKNTATRMAPPYNDSSPAVAARPGGRALSVAKYSKRYRATIRLPTLGNSDLTAKVRYFGGGPRDAIRIGRRRREQRLRSELGR